MATSQVIVPLRRSVTTCSFFWPSGTTSMRRLTASASCVPRAVMGQREVADFFARRRKETDFTSFAFISTARFMRGGPPARTTARLEVERHGLVLLEVVVDRGRDRHLVVLRQRQRHVEIDEEVLEDTQRHVAPPSAPASTTPTRSGARS